MQSNSRRATAVALLMTVAVLTSGSVLTVVSSQAAAAASGISGEVADPTPSAPSIGTLTFDRQPVRGTTNFGRMVGTTGYPVPVHKAVGLPAGLVMSEDGRVTGKPTKNGLSTVTVSATNELGTATKKYKVRVMSRGAQGGYISFSGTSTTLTPKAKKDLKAMVKKMPKGWEMDRVSIWARMHYTGSSSAAKKAQARAQSIAAYLKKLGVPSAVSDRYYDVTEKGLGVRMMSQVSVHYYVP